MQKNSVWKLTRIGLLAAVAFVLYFFEIPVGMPFYKLDFSTFPAILAGFSMGPTAGLWVVLIKLVAHLPFSTTAFAFYVGDIADLLMSGAFVLISSLLYARNKTRRGAFISLGAGIVCIAVVGALSNYFIMLPVFSSVMGLESIMGAAQAFIPGVDDFFKLVVYITAPFNLLKGAALSAVTLLTYKRLSPLLHQRAR